MSLHDLQRNQHLYTILLVGISVLLALFIVLPSDLSRIILAFATGIFYTVWGLVSHKPKHLTARLVLEYALIGAVGTVILLSLLGSI